MSEIQMIGSFIVQFQLINM